MSIVFTNTPPELQPVLSDGIYFTLSSSTYNASTTYKFRYIYQLLVEDQLVFEGKCSPNPFGLGIVDLQQVLETYTDSLPISYWDTTPIYTHQTIAFSRPANEQVINYYIRTGYEYADSEISPVTGFTGWGNSVGAPAVDSNVYKVWRSTMGTNGRATQQDFDVDPYVLSGAPQGIYPTTSGLFFTNAPRILDIADTEYFTLGFSNYYLWSGNTTGLSQPYYVEYNFYNDQGALIRTDQYDNIVSNGGGPRTSCTDVYQALYLLYPPSGTTDYNSLYVGAGPENIPNFPTNCAQYTVQLFGIFTGSTSPIQPTPTPTPTISSTPVLSPTPTPSTTPFCVGCTEYQITWTGESIASGTITSCSNGQTVPIQIQPNLTYNICSCDYPVFEVAVTILTGGPCGPTPTPSNTPTSTPSCVCGEYVVENLSSTNIDYIQYINCYGNPTTYPLGPLEATTFCACINSIESAYSEVTYLGPCVVPQTPTPTRTPTMTPTPSSTQGCYLTWIINLCSSTCSGGICTCTPGGTQTVYTNCSVEDLTDPSTEIFENTGLTNPFTGDFSQDGSIWNSTGANVSLVCVIGGPC